MYTFDTTALNRIIGPAPMDNLIEKGNKYEASHKSNPSSIPQGYVDSDSTLPCITWVVVTGVQG